MLKVRMKFQRIEDDIPQFLCKTGTKLHSGKKRAFQTIEIKIVRTALKNFFS